MGSIRPLVIGLLVIFHECVVSGAVINQEKITGDKILPKTEGRFKRFVQEEACPTTEGWVQLTTAINLQHQHVEVQAGQSFWKRECSNTGSACRGFPGTSSCLNKMSWVFAYARPRGSTGNYTPNYIAIETCCTCAVTI